MTDAHGSRTDLQGGDPQVVRDAFDRGEPLPGTRGFAGLLDGRLVRDVLGRYPLFVEGNDAPAWSFEPDSLSDPVPFPAGHVRDDGGTRRAWTLPDPPPRADESAVIETLRAAIRESLEAVPADGLAIAFSGGVDSATLAARLDAPLSVVGFPDSHDVETARAGSERLGRDLRVVELDHDRLRRAIPRVVRATGRTNAMDVSIALPLYCLAERVAADGFETLALGQGADELFGGYAKIAHAPDDHRVAADTVRGARSEVVETLPDQLARDALAVRAGGVEPVLPLLHDDVVRTALALPEELLVTADGERKWALRLAAREWLPDAIAFREKKAMQYGSLVSRELDRLARQAGFKGRQDDHVRNYVESLVE